MQLFPSRLISIKTYGSPQAARRDQVSLNKAGIPNYLGWNEMGHTLQVPEEVVPAAIEILGIEEDHDLPLAELGDEAIRCPQCQSVEVDPLPPYVFLPGFLFCAIVAVFAYRGEMANGSIVVIAGALFLFWLAPRIPKWRCRICGNKWHGAPPKVPGR